MTSTITVAAPPLRQSTQVKMACPHMFVAVASGQEPDNEYALRGRQTHDVLLEHVNHLVNSRVRRDDAHFQALLDRGLLPDARMILEQIGESFEIDPEQVLAAEERLALDEDFRPIEVGDPTPVAYDGKPDLILLADKTATVRDYKSQFQIVAADTFQGKLYSLLVLLHYPFIQKVIFELRFVRYHSVPRTEEYTRADIGRMKAMVKSERLRQLEMLRMRPEDAPAMPGPHCAWCPKLTRGCPVASMNPYSIESPEDRLKFAVWVAQAKKQNDQVLKDLVSARGPVATVDGNGNRYTAEFVPATRTSYPLIPTLQVVGEYQHETGEAIHDKLQVSASKLNQLAATKKRSRLAVALSAVKQSVTFTRFHLAGDDEPEDESA